MSNVIKKCPKDGTEYAPDFGGACESCLTPLQFYCKKHDQWLVDDSCNRCTKEGISAAGDGAKTLLSIGIFVVVVLALLGVGGAGLYFALKPRAPRPLPPSTPVAVTAPAPVAAPPLARPVFPDYPPVRIGLAQVSVDGDSHVGKLIEVTGVVQLLDAGKRQFVLQQGNNTLEVHSDQTAVANGQTIIVTGLLQRDEAFNSYFLIAQHVRVTR